MFVGIFILLLAFRQKHQFITVYAAKQNDGSDERYIEQPSRVLTHFEQYKWLKGLCNPNETLSKKIKWMEAMKLYPMQNTHLDF